jgi:tRNA/tmRNA/rRNA uracil-C5-methylase (TrmA/RlmC/RlmD family)
VGEGSLRGLELGIAALPTDVQSRVSVTPGAAEDIAHTLPLRGAHVIVDPPRKGLHARVLGALQSARPARITYLSCGLDSFLRDATELCASGFACKALTAYALFPFTDHAEILAIFENSASS